MSAVSATDIAFPLPAVVSRRRFIEAMPRCYASQISAASTDKAILLSFLIYFRDCIVVLAILRVAKSGALTQQFLQGPDLLKASRASTRHQNASAVDAGCESTGQVPR